MARVHAPRLVLLLVPAMAAVGDRPRLRRRGQVGAARVGARRCWRRSLAILLARRDAATALARIAAATGTVPYAGRLHPDGSWRGHVAGPGAAQHARRRRTAAPPGRPPCTPTTPTAFAEACAARRARRVVRGRVPDRAARRRRRARSGTGCCRRRAAPSRASASTSPNAAYHRAAAVEHPPPAGERAAPAGRHRRDRRDAATTTPSWRSTRRPAATRGASLLPDDHVHPDDLNAYYEALGTIRRGGRVAVPAAHDGRRRARAPAVGAQRPAHRAGRPPVRRRGR